MSPGADQRRHPRFNPLLIKAEFEWGDRSGEGYVTNLSEGGAFLATEDTPSVNEILLLTLTLPWNLGRTAALAEVVWTTSQPGARKKVPSGAGLRFTEISPEAIERLRAYMTRFSELASKLG